MSDHVFVVGVPRSGTTLLQEILSTKANIALCPETHFFSTLIHKGVKKHIKHLVPADTDDKLRQLSKILKSGKIFGMLWINWAEQIDLDKVMENFAKTDRALRDLFDQIIKEYARGKGASRGGEKTPSHLFHVGTLVDWFPECRVIHILRDPRALLLSEMNKDIKPDYFFTKSNPMYNVGLFFWVAVGWWLAIHLHERYEKKYPENYMMLKNESLVLNPEAKVKAICDFIGIDWKEDMAELPPMVNTSFQGDTSHNPMERWKTLLPKKYVFLLNLTLRRHLKKHGYLD